MGEVEARAYYTIVKLKIKKMSASALRNQVQLIGHLGKTPEIKMFGTDRKLATFTLATTEIYYDNKGEKQEETQWHNIAVWGKPAEIIEKYTDKGSEILVSGKIATRSYNDKDGNKKYFTEVIASEVLLLGKKPEKVS